MTLVLHGLAMFFMASAVYEQSLGRYDRAAYYASLTSVLLLVAQ